MLIPTPRPTQSSAAEPARSRRLGCASPSACARRSVAVSHRRATAFPGRQHPLCFCCMCSLYSVLRTGAMPPTGLLGRNITSPSGVRAAKEGALWKCLCLCTSASVPVCLCQVQCQVPVPVPVSASWLFGADMTGAQPAVRQRRGVVQPFASPAWRSCRRAGDRRLALVGLHARCATVWPQTWPQAVGRAAAGKWTACRGLLYGVCALWNSSRGIRQLRPAAPQHTAFGEAASTEPQPSVAQDW